MNGPSRHDPRWPRASQWLADVAGKRPGHPDFGLLGVPAHLTSLSATNAHETPVAVRAALARYATWVESIGKDLRDLWAVDLGDVDKPDGDAGEQRTMARLAEWHGALLVALGGDNSITYALARGMRASGLVTLDAHHDVRDGSSNGSPVQRLVADGMDGRRIVQIGIADFANSYDYAHRALDYGITVIHREEVERVGMPAIMKRALAIAGEGQGARVHVDLDVDVCDRAVAPACPASVPGGLTANELRQAARAAGADSRVVSVDLAEVDAAADAADQRTVRLAALCVLEAAAGFLTRD